MNRRRGVLLALLLLAGIGLGRSGSAEDPIARLRLAATVIDADLPRYGLNLGGSGTWGAEQLRANVLANPGFEPVLDRTLLIVKAVQGNRIVDDVPWLARTDGFWSNARYDIRSGPLAGRSGRVLDSRKRPDDGLAEITLDQVTAGLGVGDVVSLTRTSDLEPAPKWWRGQGRIGNSRNDCRPGSAGRQALRLLAMPDQPAEILHYLDAIADRAGKLLPLDRPWRLGLWARAVEPGAHLHLHLDRAGKPAFLDRTLTLDTEWTYHEVAIDADDSGPPGTLTLGLRAEDGEVRIDDVYLGEAEPGVGGFRQVVVEMLRALRPGYLRDWQGQLGDTLDNRLAASEAHQPVRYRPGANEVQFHYGLPEFLALCQAIGARPWLVAPTTFDDDEWRRFGAYLRVAADLYGFDQVLVEFGNENWNQIFRPAGIPDPVRHVAVAERGMALLRAGSDNDPRLVSVLNAQFVNPESPRQVGALSRLAERIAVAPYFLYRLEAGTGFDQALEQAFAETGELIAQESQVATGQGKRLAAYELNFHTTLGDADPSLRNAVVTGAASGPALARRLLQGTLAGVREQTVYKLAGLDTFLQGSRELVRLWGVSRDLTAPQRLRPTGLALQLLNRVAGGETRAFDCRGGPCAGLTALAFDGGRRMALVSAHAEPVPVEIAYRCDGASLQAGWLDGSDPTRNNENEQQVNVRWSRLDCAEDRLDLTLPAHSLVVIGPYGMVGANP